MRDETIITETPPLYHCYGRRGEPVSIPVSGNHARRVLHGVINVRSGDVLLLITDVWDQDTHQAFLTMIRAHWRGWHVVLFEERGSPHTAGSSRQYAKALGLELRFLPRVAPELNAMDHLWRHVKGRVLATRTTQTIDTSADVAWPDILEMGRTERLRKAGGLSGRFRPTT